MLFKKGNITIEIINWLKNLFVLDINIFKFTKILKKQEQPIYLQEKNKAI